MVVVGWHVAWASGAFQEGLFPVGITPELLKFPVMQKIQVAKELHSDLVILQLSGGDGKSTDGASGIILRDRNLIF